MAENDTLNQSAFPTQPIWVPPGGYKRDLEMVVIMSTTSTGKSFFTSHQTVEALTSM